MSGRELITLQLGHHANFVGAHFWNTQEAEFSYESDSPSDVCHDVCFRVGRNHRGEETYTPRTVIVDLKGSLRALSTASALYDDDVDPDTLARNCGSTWAGSVLVQKAEQAAQSAFHRELDEEAAQPAHDSSLSSSTPAASASSSSSSAAAAVPVEKPPLDESIEVWSDYMRTYLHPRSLQIVREHSHANRNSTEDPFDRFHQGHQLTQHAEFLDDYESSVRFFAEESDSLQGFHLLCDATNGFGGLSAALVETLFNDDYAKKPILGFPIMLNQLTSILQSQPRQDQSTLTTALTMASLASHIDFTVPLSVAQLPWRSLTPVSFKHVSRSFNAQSVYQTSALIASALDTCTLSYRLTHADHRHRSLGSLTHSLSRLSSASVGYLSAHTRLPASAVSLAALWGVDDNHDPSKTPQYLPLHSSLDMLSPCRTPAQHQLPRFQSVVMRGVCDSPNMPADDLLAHYTLKTAGQLSSHQSISIPSRFPTTRPFPSHLFAADTTTPEDSTDVAHTAMLTNLSTGACVGTMLSGLHSDALTVARRSSRLALKMSGMDPDDGLEALEQLLNIAEGYLDE